MLTIKKGSENKVIVTVTQHTTDRSPKFYLFSFLHILSKETIRFFMTSQVVSNNRYDEFLFTEVSDTTVPEDLLNGKVILPYEGQYFYSVYEMGSLNLDPAYARVKLEEGRAMVYGDDPIYYNPYISDNENNSNFIYL